jgi:AcrR family transcriptional regulator
LKTKDKILDVAEVMFSEHGITETSLRAITQKAGVNIASVNYHFGSKKNLIQAVFHRLLARFFDAYFAALAGETSVSREQALQAAARAIINQPDGLDYGRRFMKFLQAAYAQQQAHLRRYLQTEFHDEYVLFLGHLAGHGLSKSEQFEFFWRLQFLLGAVMFSISEYRTLDAITDSEYGLRLAQDSLESLFVPTALAILESK